VCVYSLRATDDATVSTPLRWEEVEEAAAAEDPAPLRLTAAEALARLDRDVDLFARAARAGQRLPSP
jgi:bifunctional non-homologous end joining protein LigD